MYIKKIRELPRLKKPFHKDHSPYDIWKLFYGDFPKSEYISGENISADCNNGECFIYNSMFNNISNNSAIYFNHSNSKFLYSDCLFVNCSSNNYAASIYFDCISSIIQYRSCGYMSKAINGKYHACAVCEDSTDYLNYIHECSFYQCGDIENGETNYLMFGNVSIKSINTTSCNAHENSGIRINQLISPCNITYSTYYNTSTICTVLRFENGEYNLKFCNVLNNQLNKSDSELLSAAVANSFITNCSFLGNTMSGVDFHAFTCYIIVHYCYCDRWAFDGNVVSGEVHTNLYSINRLPHFSSYACEAEYPIYLNNPTCDEEIYHKSHNLMNSFGIISLKN